MVLYWNMVLGLVNVLRQDMVLGLIMVSRLNIAIE
jgi:hypothetical protein